MSLDFSHIESPGLLVYPEIVAKNIDYVLALVNNNPDRLRPHIKTHKTQEVNEMMMRAGIYKFKCATIAEAELLAISEAKDVLLSMQATGTTLARLIKLVQQYPNTQFSCLIDDVNAAEEIQSICLQQHVNLHVFIDLNVGMNRTGILPEHASNLIQYIDSASHVSLKGLHAYDGHIRDEKIDMRKAHADKDLESFRNLVAGLDRELELVVGGTPSFLVHCQNPAYVCSPGTFVFFDAGYAKLYPENSIDFAVEIVARIISKPSPTTICIDLGHKSVAPENPIQNRVRFIDYPEWELLSQSEEHGIVEVGSHEHLPIGQVIRMIPYHICPTVALHQSLQVIENGNLTGLWEVKARNRKINI
jgi:D-serine deaminase-like pyridoxal phosphate-dependent protein